MSGEVIRITINDNETIMVLLNRMLNIKNENNNDVECELNGNVLTTKDCSNIQDMLLKNSDIIFNEYEIDREVLLNTSDMVESFDKFRSRGDVHFDNDEEKEQIASDVKQQEREFNELLSELDTLDFSKSLNVFQWLNSITPYMNNVNLYLSLGYENIEYATVANYIVQKLQQNGYSIEKNPINNFDDYYKRLISYQLNDLDKYGFFAYEYADNLKEQGKITKEDYDKAKEMVKEKQQSEIINEVNEETTVSTEIEEEQTTNEEVVNNSEEQIPTSTSEVPETVDKVESKQMHIPNPIMSTIVANNQELAEIEEKIKKNTKNIDAINMYRQGRIDNFGNVTKAFSIRKEEIQNKINELKAEPLPKIDSKQEFIDADNKVNEFIEKNNLADKRQVNAALDNALIAYQTAAELPEDNLLMKALEGAFKLPSDGEIRPLLIDAIYKLDSCYRETSEENEMEEIQKKLNDVFSTLRATPEEQSLFEQYQNLLENPSTLAIEVILQQMFTLPKTSLLSLIKEQMYTVLLTTRKNLIETNMSISLELKELEDQYYDIEIEEEKRVIRTEEKLKYFQEQKVILSNKYADVKNNIGNDHDDYNKGGGGGSSTEDLNTVDLNSEADNYSQNNDSENQFAESQTNNENEEYIKKLQSVGQVFVDSERRIDKENSWMELNTAISLKKLNDDDKQIDNEPHIITDIQKASMSLIEKIRSIDFKASVRKVLDFMKKNGEAVAFSVAFAATATIGAFAAINNSEADIATMPEVSMEAETNIQDNSALSESIENAIDNNENINLAIEDTKVEENISNEEVNSPSLENQIEQAKENILNGAAVYTTASNAISDINPVTPSSTQLERSWENATASSYYTMNDGKLTSLSETEAQMTLSNGGQVIVGMENNGTGIGYTALEQQETVKTI